MVVFTCNHCGESLHKPKVEKHYQYQCRNYKSVTCVDCFKDFRNEEYVAHIKCITEDERYAAKGTYKQGIVKKGDVKQESWLEMIKSICDSEKNLRPSLRHLLETISEYNNVPRKKPKFMNFIKSSSGNRANLKEVEEVWNIIEKHKAKTSRHNQNITKIDIGADKNNEIAENGKKRVNDSGDNSESPKKKKKETLSTDIIEEETLPKFDYKAKILEILTKKQTISYKKLQKKVVKAYLSWTSQADESEEKIIKKFNKKLRKIPNISIEDGKVLLTI